MNDYNIHCLLYDITRGHFKSKWLCKHNKHNYQLHREVEYIPEISYEYSPDGRSIISKCKKYNKIWTTYYKCYCCGKKIDLEKEVS